MAQIDGVVAELESIIETADLIAHDGLQPGSDGFRVMAGLVSQLANQTARILDAGFGTGGVAVFSAAESFAAIAPGTATLTDFTVPGS